MRVSGLTKNGDWQFGRGRANYKNASDAIAQKVVTRIRSFRRDWFLDVQANIDWLRLLGSKGVRVSTIRSEVERVVRETEGVARVDRVSIDFNRASREVTVNVAYTDVFNMPNSLEGLTI